MNDASPLPPTSADTIEAALSQLTSRPASRATDPGTRRYSLRDTAVVMATFGAALLLLDTDGVLAWARRMELGPAQAAWLSVLAPMHQVASATGLTQPRAVMAAFSDRVSHAFGTDEDPLLEQGWAPATDSSKADEEQPSSPPPEVAEVDARLAPAGPEEDAPTANLEHTDGTFTILVVGDSLIAGSLGTTLRRALRKNPRFRVVEAFQLATGLARPDVYDWNKIIPPLVARERPDLVICSLGANDATTLYDEQGAIEFGEAGWRRAYGTRVATLMRALVSHGARAVWLGLPPMRDGVYAGHVRTLNALYAQTAKRIRGLEFLEVGMLLSNDAGRYSTFLTTDDGRFVRIRLDDGIHYAPAGARAVSRWVVDWVNERLRRRAARAP